MGAVGDGPFLLILFIGAVIVLVDGQLIFRNGPAYLARVYRSPEHARQVSSLVAVLFHLVMLGLVALVASVGWHGPPSPSALIARVGVLLLLTALGHAATIAVLSRLREQQMTTDIAESQVTAIRRDDSQRPPPPDESVPDEPLVGGAVSGLPPEDPDSDPLTRTPRGGWRGRWPRSPR
jgi:hypothetical protein